MNERADTQRFTIRFDLVRRGNEMQVCCVTSDLVRRDGQRLSVLVPEKSLALRDIEPVEAADSGKAACSGSEAMTIPDGYAIGRCTYAQKEPGESNGEQEDEEFHTA